MPELLLIVAALMYLLGVWLLLYALPWSRALDERPCQTLCVLFAFYPRVAMWLTERDERLEEMLDVVLIALAREGLKVERPVIRVCGSIIPPSAEGAAAMKRYGFIAVSRFCSNLPPGKLLFVVAHEVGHLLLYHYREGHWLLDALQGGEEIRADAIAWLVARSVLCHAQGREMDRALFIIDVMPALLARAQGSCPVPTTAAP